MLKLSFVGSVDETSEDVTLLSIVFIQLNQEHATSTDLLAWPLPMHCVISLLALWQALEVPVACSLQFVFILEH